MSDPIPEPDVFDEDAVLPPELEDGPDFPTAEPKER